MPIERRCAIVPGSDFLSPEEAQLILRHRESSCSLAVSCLDRGPSQVTRRLAKASRKDNQAGSTWRPRALENPETWHQNVQDCPDEPHLASRISTNDAEPPRSFRVSSIGQQDPSDSQGFSRIQSNNKRKHAMGWQDSPRRHPAEVLEDTPHVSELNSDDGINPMEVTFPSDQGPLGAGDKVSFHVHSLKIRVRKY